MANTAAHGPEKWEAGGADIAALHRALVRIEGFAGTDVSDLQPMRAKGLVHAHVRVRGTGAVLRIPRYSSYGFEPAANLAYQAECFRRAGESGHVPPLLGLVEPQAGIPWGALAIAEISGRAPRLPAEMAAIARALAAIHALPVPAAEDRAPLPSPGNPVRATMSVIEKQATFLADSAIHPQSRRQLDTELAWARDYATCERESDPPVTLVGTDTHPGNFMIRDDGTAIFVDLEKTLYGAPGIDLAHASVYTSTMWDDDIATALTDAEVAGFYRDYFGLLPPPLARRIRPGSLALRRLTWLRTTTWAAKWKVEAHASTGGTAEHDPAYLEKVHVRIDDYLSPDTIERIRSGFAASADRL